MSGPTREQVRAWAEQSGVCWVSPTSGALFPAVREDCEMAEEVERLVSLAYAAGQAAERANIPPAPLIVDASHIDSEALADAIKSMKSARRVLVAGTPSPDEIAAAVAAEREAITNMPGLNLSERQRYAILARGQK